LRAAVGRLAALAGAQAAEGSLIALLNAYEEPCHQPSAQRVDDLLTILLAGHDTITSALTWTFALVAAHPEVDRALRAEWRRVLSGRDATAADAPGLIYTRAVLAESLRLYPPAWVLARHAIAPHRFDDTEVAAGTIVLVSQYLLHRDERFFARPRSFDPRRWVTEEGPGHPRFAYFPFGAGARACIGEAFGWLEGVLLMATIGQRWRLEAVSPFPEIDLRITLRPGGPVLMKAEVPAD
jgi:cytochrome P450